MAAEQAFSALFIFFIQTFFAGGLLWLFLFESIPLLMIFTSDNVVVECSGACQLPLQGEPGPSSLRQWPNKYLG
jgi:hypothetical protein